MTNSEYTPYPMNEKNLKRFALGERAKVLLDLHLEDPKKFTNEFIVEQLIKEYKQQKLDYE